MPFALQSEAAEVISQCEGCSKPIHDGDAYHAGSEVDLCSECAPDFADMLASPQHFLDSDDNEMAPEDAKARVDAHLAAGGSLSDKIVRT